MREMEKADNFSVSQNEADVCSVCEGEEDSNSSVDVLGMETYRFEPVGN